MRLDLEEMNSVIDSVINIETNKAIQKDLHELTQIGERQPTQVEMSSYVYAMREVTQRRLEQSN